MIRLREISDYRPELMGIAITFIMAYHSLGRYALYGNIGVEWFLLLSGVGMFYSLSNGHDIKDFYLKRFVRIIPTYLLVAVPFFLLKIPSNLFDFFIRVSGMNLFLFDERYFWFITLILICYLIAPLYYKLIVRYKSSIIIPFLLVLLFTFFSHKMPRAVILVMRIPTFIRNSYREGRV